MKLPSTLVCLLLAAVVSQGLQAADEPTLAPASTPETLQPEITASEDLRDFDLNKLLFDGVAALEKGALDTGRLKFKKALEIDSNNVTALVNLGSLEYRAHHLDEAESALRKATRLSPDTFAAWMTLGVVAHDAGKLDLALAALAQAVLIEPSNPKAHAYLGVTLGRKGWLDGAEAELHRALALDETSRDAHFNLAVICLQQNPPSIELARRHYRRALDLGASRDEVIEKQLGQEEKSVK